MTELQPTQFPSMPSRGLRPARLEPLAFWLLVATLAWAPFPLGSNRQWSESLLILMVALCWLVWWVAAWEEIDSSLRALSHFRWPSALAISALVWGLVQTASWVPADWIHPLWPVAGEILGSRLPGAISLDPWRTEFAVLKLATYMAVTWLAYMYALRPDRARQLLDAIIMIGAFYAVYALVLGAIHIFQFQVFYATIPVGNYPSGPFVLHNSYATYAGMGSIAALVRLFGVGGDVIRQGQGFRPLTLSLLQFAFGRGAPSLIAFILTFSTLIFSASRAGVVSTIFGLVVILFLSFRIVARRVTATWTALGVIAAIGIVVALFFISGDTLQSRLDALVQAGGADNLRLMAWTSAQRMISGSPWLGLGLGSYENAFPLYSTDVIPYTLDKAHCDYLELAAGWGLPAASAWWLALLLLIVSCVRGVFVRRRNRIYPLVAVGISALVGLHSAFDFSLQIPAVAFTYAVVLGLGSAQSFPTRTSHQ